MAALSERKIAVVRTLVESAPDRVVGSLQHALAATADDSALGGVRRLVEAEVFERTVRNTVLAPIVPMCVGAGDSKRYLTFPSRALGLLWRGLCEVEAAAIQQARETFKDSAPAPAVLDAYDRLTGVAAAELRAGSGAAFRSAAEACGIARPNGAELLAACLDIAPVVRRAVPRLPEWTAHLGGETNAAARLAYKDAVAIAEDSGARFFEMLAAQLAHPWMVMRIISAVMDKPTERYLADSELATFGETVLADIDEALASIAALDADQGPPAGTSAAKSAELVVQQIQEIENSIALQREHGWGARIHKQRTTLATVVENRLRAAEKAVAEALPMYTPRGGRVRRTSPRLSAPPDAGHIRQAMALLTFSEGLHVTANYGGFSSTRAKVIERLAEYVANYVEEVLDHIRTGDVEDLGIASAFLDVAADINRLLLGDKAADLVRRRAHAAIAPKAHAST